MRRAEDNGYEGMRLAWLGQALREHRVLVVLDNFEDNLLDGGDAFRDSATEALVRVVLDAAGRGRVLVTSRLPVGPFAGRLYDVRVLPLSRSQARKLLLRLPALEGLSVADTGAVLRGTGGHPRLIELVDAAMRGNPSRLTSMADRLDRHAAELGIDLSTPRGDLTAAVADALDIALRDIALTALVEGLPATARELLLQAAVSRIPVSGSDLAAMTGLGGSRAWGCWYGARSSARSPPVCSSSSAGPPRVCAASTTRKPGGSGAAERRTGE